MANELKPCPFCGWNYRPVESALVEALKRLLEEHSCDDGSVDYKWSEGGCATCQQARAALKDAGVDVATTLP